VDYLPFPLSDNVTTAGIAWKTSKKDSLASNLLLVMSILVIELHLVKCAIDSDVLRALCAKLTVCNMGQHDRFSTIVNLLLERSNIVRFLRLPRPSKCKENTYKYR